MYVNFIHMQLLLVPKTKTMAVILCEYGNYYI